MGFEVRDLDDIGAELSLLRVMRRVISECGGVHRGRGPALGLAQRKYAPGGEQTVLKSCRKAAARSETELPTRDSRGRAISSGAM